MLQNPNRKKTPGGARPGSGYKAGTRKVPQQTRDLIKTGVLVNRAQRLASGTLAIKDPQVEAVRAKYLHMLLNKVLPDLTRAELTGGDGGPLEIITRAE